MEDISITFIEHSKMIMKRTGKTQKQLADEIGICYSTINKTFNNYRALEFSLAVKIASNLGISIDKIYKLDYNNEKNTDSIQGIADEMDDLIRKLRKHSKK